MECAALQRRDALGDQLAAAVDEPRLLGAVFPGPPGNLVVVLLFGVSWYLRVEDPYSPPIAAVALSIAGVLLSAVTAWLGGELVDRLGVGVDDGASLDAPNSMLYPKAR